jgi:hypothetical protein
MYEEPSEELKRELGIQAYGFKERSEAFTEAFEVTTRESFGQPKMLRCTLAPNNKVFKSPEPMFAKHWYNSIPDEDKPLVRKIEKLWPETNTWETVFENGKWL